MKKALTITGFVFLSLVTLYCAGWGYLYHEINEEITEIYENAKKDGVEFLGKRPIVTGFPLVPEIFYGGGIKHGDMIVTFSELRIKGFHIPGTPMNISFPKGIAFAGYVNPEIWSLDSVSVDFTCPSNFPAEFVEEDLKAWQQSGGKIDITNMNLKKETLDINASGIFTLDSALQPAFELDSSIAGYNEFIDYLQHNGIIRQMPAIAASVALNALAEKDGDKNSVKVKISLSDRLLKVASLQVVRVPEIRWDRHSQPVEHQ